MTELLQLDQVVFHWINSGSYSGFLDHIIPYFREESLWVPLYVFLVIFLIMNFRKQGLAMVIAVVLTAGASDYISSRVVKNNVQRIRPCNDNNVKYQMILRVPCGSGYSFTSSHATNHFAVASILVMLLSRIWGWVRWPLYLWAASIAFAQVYVGVHYPLDVIFGALLGFGIAKFVYFLFRKTNFSLGEIVY